MCVFNNLKVFLQVYAWVVLLPRKFVLLPHYGPKMENLTPEEFTRTKDVRHYSKIRIEMKKLIFLMDHQ